MKPKVRITAITLCILTPVICAWTQSTPHGLERVTHSASLSFFLSDGTCAWGTIAKVDATAIIIKRGEGAPIRVRRNQLLQVQQGNAILFSARSSWFDVVHTPVISGEELILDLKNGDHVKGRPSRVTGDSIMLKHAFSRTTYPKSSIATVTYLRVRPETDNFDYLSQEAPYLLFFDPEFYSRAFRLEGRIPVRLYDSSKPEDDAPLHCPHK